jgi:hypothetical protein
VLLRAAVHLQDDYLLGGLTRGERAAARLAVGHANIGREEIGVRLADDLAGIKPG